MPPIETDVVLQQQGVRLVAKVRQTAAASILSFGLRSRDGVVPLRRRDRTRREDCSQRDVLQFGRRTVVVDHAVRQHGERLAEKPVVAIRSEIAARPQQAAAVDGIDVNQFAHHCHAGVECGKLSVRRRGGLVLGVQPPLAAG